MDKEKRKAFLNMLRKMSKKGFYDTLEFICEKQSVHYADMLKFAVENHIVQSRATVTLIVRGLLKLNLIKRTVDGFTTGKNSLQTNRKGFRVVSLSAGNRSHNSEVIQISKLSSPAFFLLLALLPF